MVKRVIAVGVGAIAGIALWYAVHWLHTPADADVISIETCVHDAYVDCVGFAPDGNLAPQVCKDWLTGDAGAALLSECLHGARRERDAVRIKNFERAQRIAASS